MVEHIEAPQTDVLVLVEEVLSPAKDVDLDVSDLEDLFDDFLITISRQNAAIRKYRQNKPKVINH